MNEAWKMRGARGGGGGGGLLLNVENGKEIRIKMAMARVRKPSEIMPNRKLSGAHSSWLTVVLVIFWPASPIPGPLSMLHNSFGF